MLPQIETENWFLSDGFESFEIYYSQLKLGLNYYPQKNMSSNPTTNKF